MKKLVSLLLVFVMVAAMAAGCTGEKPAETTTEPEVVVPASALEILENVWALYGDDEKFFCMGGDFNNPVDNAPGNYSLEDAEMFSYQLYVPADQVASVDQAASLIHAMNTNTFTSGVFHMAEGVDATAFAAAVRENVQSAQWMCGFPEKLIVAVVGGEYVLMVFGLEDAVNPFETKLAEAYPDAVIAYNEAITG